MLFSDFNRFIFSVISTRTNPIIPDMSRQKMIVAVITIVRLRSMLAKFKVAALFQVLAKLLVTREAEEENSCRPLVEEEEEDELDADKRRWSPPPHRQVVLVAVAAIGVQSGFGVNALPSHMMHCGVKAKVGHWYPISPTLVPLQTM